MARLAVLCVLATLLSGCGTTDKTGGVRDTLTSRTLRATLLKAVPTVRQRPGHTDVTGLSLPGAGHHFTAVKMQLCRTEHGPAVTAYAFELELDDGDRLRPRQPETVYPDDFEVSRANCETGWIVYAVPDGSTPESIRLRYDDTGSNRPGHREEHARFTWSL